MSQLTDTIQPVPLADSPQAQTVGETTQEMPTVTLPVAPAVPVLPPQPVFDPVRARMVHTNRVLTRLLNTAALPTPDKAALNAYGDGIELLVHTDIDGTALKPFADLFGGTVASEDRDNSFSVSGRSRYAELLTVVDGVYVRVWSLTDLPAVEQPVEDPQQAYCCGNPEDHAHPAEAAEPEPQHDPAPAPQPETPVEHPEAA